LLKENRFPTSGRPPLELTASAKQNEKLRQMANQQRRRETREAGACACPGANGHRVHRHTQLPTLAMNA
jgi:hypothetical protein